MAPAPAFSGSAARARREAAGLTQAELARRVGVTRGHMRNLESGFRQPSFPTASAIARELGATLEDITARGELVAP